MTAIIDAEEHRLWHSWRVALGEPSIVTLLVRLYRRLDEAVADRRPTCWLSGRCCHFDTYGHRLYVTGLELTWVLVQAWPKLPGPPPMQDVSDWSICPFQSGKLCSIHSIRPMGCRVFFCQQGTESWQRELYERFLCELRILHDEHALAYRYMEWRAAMRRAMIVFTTESTVRRGDG